MSESSNSNTTPKYAQYSVGASLYPPSPYYQRFTSTTYSSTVPNLSENGENGLITMGNLAAKVGIGKKTQIYDVGTSGGTVNDSMAKDSGEKRTDDRGQWGNQIEFILACVGYAVGLGNVWRFPYLCFKNGGGAFLIPYAISLLIAGLPIFYLELCLGQFSSLGPNVLFGKLIPLMQGVGWGMVVVSFLVALYYNMIIAWVLFYFFASFRSELQWATCTNEWNTYKCQSNLEDITCQNNNPGFNVSFFNKTCWNTTDLGPGTDVFNFTQVKRSAAEEYFERYVLNMSDSFEDIGGVQWKLALSLLAAWIIVFLCLIKGVQSTGKVVYFTATFPYVVLVILMIRGVTLDGAELGIQFYMNPNYTKLKEIEVWKDAAVQIFYSLGPAFGGLLTMSSYNKFNNNCFRDAVLVAFTNCGTSVFAGFAVFSIAGFMAKQLEVDVKDVVRDGTGLAFIAYPEAIVRMPVAPLWSILFFFMLVTLGLDSQFAMLETCTTALMDQFTSLRKYKTSVVALACFVCFLLGLPLCCRGGIYIFQLLNDYSAGYCLILLAFLELITVMYIYGIKNFTKDIDLMLGQKTSWIAKLIGPTGWYWKVCWMFFSPVFLIAIFILTLAFYGKSGYGDYVFSPLAEGLGFFISALSWIMVPLFMVIKIVMNRINKRPWRELITKTPSWCPADKRQERRADLESSEMYKYNASNPYPSGTAIAYSNGASAPPAKY